MVSMDIVSEEEIRKQANKDGVTHLSTGAAVVRDQKILMVRRSKDDFLGGYYELPGGGVDEGESIQESAIREVLEETGLIVDQVVDVFEGFDYATDKKPHVRQINFLVTVKPGEVSLSPEHDIYTWVDYDTIAALKMTDNMRRCVTNALAIADPA
jgi:8-oxo-dGTP diphosphatase